MRPSSSSRTEEDVFFDVVLLLVFIPSCSAREFSKEDEEEEVEVRVLRSEEAKRRENSL